jgi:hypothetical protein
VASQAATVADSGRNGAEGDTKIAVTAGERGVNDFGRS